MLDAGVVVDVPLRREEAARLDILNLRLLVGYPVAVLPPHPGSGGGAPPGEVAEHTQGPGVSAPSRAEPPSKVGPQRHPSALGSAKSREERRTVQKKLKGQVWPCSQTPTPEAVRTEGCETRIDTKLRLRVLFQLE